VHTRRVRARACAQLAQPAPPVSAAVVETASPLGCCASRWAARRPRSARARRVVLGEPLARERGRARGGRAGRDGGAQRRQRAVPVAPDCASAARREFFDLGARTGQRDAFPLTAPVRAPARGPGRRVGVGDGVLGPAEALIAVRGQRRSF